MGLRKKPPQPDVKPPPAPQPVASVSQDNVVERKKGMWCQGGKEKQRANNVYDKEWCSTIMNLKMKVSKKINGKSERLF